MINFTNVFIFYQTGKDFVEDCAEFWQVSFFAKYNLLFIFKNIIPPELHEIA
ncbi:hypothetical protein LV83_00536 [Algoriphagus yeomjeoni]|uniref:Uncharacterized protein n=1 Tax=Algoriphagus yeomjeoni TaxID=291403 RepID=A0A327PSE6_9BACT|nr:hypothetical protein LV83_00536 [Algoriphagus yeomjeoni]